MSATSNTTSLSYWLKWKVFICAMWVITPMVIAIYMICKYEHSYHSESEKRRNQQEQREFFCDEDSWRPCLKQIHPFWLSVFRIISFVILLGTLIADVTVHGRGILNYYTQWTFALVTIYFGLGSVLSIYGLRQRYKIHIPSYVKNGEMDAETYVPLVFDGNTSRVGLDNTLEQHTSMGNLRCVFQVIFQTTAGAVMLTDCVYWTVIFPFLTLKDYEMNCLTVLTHTLNAVTLLGDTMLNCMPFPWFRISYFLLWTGIYVFVQWIVHACVPIPWPYPFLDLSVENAAIWYLLVAALHIPCYGICALIVDFKHYLLSRCFPLQCQC